MAGFRFLTAGESHGQSLGAILEGVPAGLPLTAAQIASDLARRQRGYGRGARQQIERDRADIVSGVRHGITLGSPILLLVRNRDWENWTRVMQVEPLSEDEAAELTVAAEGGDKRSTPVTRLRPGHADLAGAIKYDFSDVRNVLERASARETAARVAAGAVARAFLAALGIEVWSFTAEVGGVAVDPERSTRTREEAEESPLRCPDPEAESRMIARIDEARSNGDTVGGVFEVVAHGLPVGLGSYVHWDRRLDAALAAAVMSINIVKGVELGLGFEQTRRFLFRVVQMQRCVWAEMEGGKLRLHGSHASSPENLAQLVEIFEREGGRRPVEKAHYERSDISVVPAAGIVGEAMVLLTLMNFALEKFGGDTLADTRDALEHYRARSAATHDQADGSGPAGSPGSTAAASASSGESGSGGDD